MKSSLKNMLLSLTGLSVLVGAALGIVNEATQEPIAEARQAVRRDALTEILPPFNNNPSQEVYQANGLSVYPATEDSQPVGWAVESFSDNGFGGRIDVIAAFDTQGRLTGYKVMSHAETPGLGAKMGDWFCMQGTAHNVIGTTAPVAVKADGGDIDAITGATITSRAFAEALNRGRETVFKISGQ